jgi:hypothetical protein
VTPIGDRVSSTAPRRRIGDLVVPVVLGLTGLIHLIPAIGVLGADQLQELYGTPVDDPDLLLLLRHRAVVFGILGVMFIAGAFTRQLRLAASLIGVASAASFVALHAATNSTTNEIARVSNIDLVLTPLLVVSVAISIPRRCRHQPVNFAEAETRTS